MYQQYSPSGFSLLPPVVKNLLIINGLFFLATVSFESAFGIDLVKLLGLHYFQSDLFQPYQFVSYMFLHGNFGHVFMNMFALWMFGTEIEWTWGTRTFARFYLLSGIAGAVLTIAFPMGAGLVIGASGAIYGVVGYFLVACRRVQVVVGYWILFLGRGTAALSTIEVFIVFCASDLLLGYMSASEGLVTMTAYWAHIGGLVAAAALAAVLSDEDEERRVDDTAPDAWVVVETVATPDEVEAVRTFMREKGVTCRALLVASPQADAAPRFELRIRHGDRDYVNALLAPPTPEGAAAPAPPPLQIRPALPPPAGNPCPVCGEGLAGRPVARCYACAASLHQDCAAEAGGCQVPGCAGNRPADPQAAREAAEGDPSLERAALGAARVMGHMGMGFGKSCLVAAMILAFFLTFFVLVVRPF